MARCGKKRDSQAFSGQTPHSAPFREMATCASALEENGGFCDFDPVMARCGTTLCSQLLALTVATATSPAAEPQVSSFRK
jgi:hypothetical protein